ncbi:unnamed protein product [Ectocarpus sp. 13 AM-2016]
MLNICGVFWSSCRVTPAYTCRLNTGTEAVYRGVLRACTRLLCAKVVFRLGCVVLPIHTCLNPSCKKHNSQHLFYPARAVERGNYVGGMPTSPTVFSTSPPLS